MYIIDMQSYKCTLCINRYAKVCLSIEPLARYMYLGALYNRKRIKHGWSQGVVRKLSP